MAVVNQVAPDFARASLTTGEQLARQQLRLEADRLDLRKLEEATRREQSEQREEATRRGLTPNP